MNRPLLPTGGMVELRGWRVVLSVVLVGGLLLGTAAATGSAAAATAAAASVSPVAAAGGAGPPGERVAGSVAGATTSPAAATAGTAPGTPLRLVGWAVCDLRLSGFEVTWAVVNLGVEDVTLTAFSSELSGVRTGDVVPARDWVAGRLAEPRSAEESLLEVSVARSEGAEQVVAGAIELPGCFGPHARLPRIDKTAGPVAVYSAAGCDGLAVAVAGPASGEEAVVSLAAPGQEPVELRARPRELSHVAVLPAEGDLTVDAVAGGEVVRTLTWVRPYDCPRGIPTVLLAGVSVVVLLVAAGAFLLTRRP